MALNQQIEQNYDDSFIHCQYFSLTKRMVSHDLSCSTVTNQIVFVCQILYGEYEPHASNFCEL